MSGGCVRIRIAAVARPAALVLLCLCLLAAGGRFARAQMEHPSQGEVGDVSSSYELLDQSLAESLKAEQQQLRELSRELSDAREFGQLCRERLNSYRLQLSAHRNMLGLPTIAAYELREAHGQHLAALNKLSERAAELEEELTRLRRKKENISSKLNSYEEQLKETGETDRSEQARGISSQLKDLIAILSAQQRVLRDGATVYEDLLEKTLSMRSEYEQTERMFEQVLAEREQKRLLKRNVNPISRAGLEQIQAEAARLITKMQRWFSYSYWSEISIWDKGDYALFALIYFLLLAALMGMLWFCRRFVTRLRDTSLEKGCFWQYMGLRLIRRSLFMAGAMLFIHFFPVKAAYQYTPLFITLDFLENILFAILVIRWGINFFDALWADTEIAFYRFLRAYFRVLLYGILAFGIVYYLLKTGVCETCVMLVLMRFAFELLLLVWSFIFWRRFHFYAKDSPIGQSRWFAYIHPLLPAAGYLVVIVGLGFEMAGYGAMAGLWYTSLCRTAVALLWLGIFYRVLKELSTVREAETGEQDFFEPEEERPMPIRRLLIRLGKTGLLVLAVLAVPVAWGARGTFLADFFFAVNYEVSLGEIRISLLDLAVAVLAILLTHTVAIVWKSLLKEKLLSHRDMEPGLKDSITTINGYIVWVVGIMIVFRVIGISAASLAFLFGAVGIGIGFGLQNIFNNFISGIILLFERPIQVGDVIEINGIWGTVTKINVRATQVKTYDNADLIIPNSDFVSRQLTNWSFKDARVRRSIIVGVAYGSDIVLVRETLNSIAINHPRVYRRPQPEVLFSDFGESALIFKLRVWVHINYFLNVETDIRFDIDKKFRELGIQIPFPQRDLHIRETSPALQKGTPAE
ncbi:MAG: mechanosensitive ion channel [Desulfosalsimonadaceae bacterium]